MKFIIVLCVVMGVFIVVESRAAEVKLQPSLAVSEDFTDNVFVTINGKSSDFITQVQPSFSLNYIAPVLTSNINYTFSYVHYARGSQDDYFTHLADAKGLFTVLKDFMFIDVKESYTHVSLNVARDNTNESLFVNQTDQNIFTASPYFVLRPGTQTTIKTGYIFANTWYRDPSAVGKTDHSAFITANRELTDKWTAEAGYTYTYEQTSLILSVPIKNTDEHGNITIITIPVKAPYDYDWHNGYAGLRYQYGEKSFVFAQGGITYYNYNFGNSDIRPFWNAGITHVFDEVTAQLGTTVTFTEDPQSNTIEELDYFARLGRKFQRGNGYLMIGYSDFEHIRSNYLNTQRTHVGFGGDYEFTQRFKGNLDIFGEKYTGNLSNFSQGSTNFPFRVVAIVKASYDLGENFLASFSYSHEADFLHLRFSNPGIGTQVNWVHLGINKTF